MRFKYYLRGCGLGLILAAIVLAVGYHRQKSDMSDAEVMRRAAELGMVMPEDERGSGSGTEGLTEAQEAMPSTEALATVQKVAGAQTDSGTRESGEGTEAGGADEQDAEKTGKGKKNTDRKDSGGDAGEEGKVTVEITRGEVCREIAEDLYEKGLVADAEEFRLFMRDGGYDDLIQTGTYTLTVGMEYGEIAEIITKKTE